MAFTPIDDIIPGSIRKSGASKQIGEAFMLVKINRIITEVLDIEVQNRIRPLYIKNNILTLACVDERLELVLKEEEHKIIQAIEKEFGANHVSEIQFLN